MVADGQPVLVRIHTRLEDALSINLALHLDTVEMLSFVLQRPNLRKLRTVCVAIHVVAIPPAVAVVGHLERASVMEASIEERILEEPPENAMAADMIRV